MCRPVLVEPREAELEAEEEEQEDDSELRDEVGHLGGADDRELLGLVRAEQEAGEEIRGDRGEPEPACGKAERHQHGHRQRQLGEGHGSILPVRTGEPSGGESKVERGREALEHPTRVELLAGGSPGRSP